MPWEKGGWALQSNYVIGMSLQFQLYEINVTHTSMETTTFLLSDLIPQLVKQMNVEAGKRKVKRDKLWCLRRRTMLLLNDN